MQANIVDTRDNRGKRHDLHLVLCRVLLAILSGKVLITEIRRWLVRHQDWLCQTLDMESVNVISDVQLRRLLSIIDPKLLYKFHTQYFGWELSLILEDSWVSVDGKELRGTIDGVMGQKRGLALVHFHLHHFHLSLQCGFYFGNKDSEMTVVRNLLENNDLTGKSFTFDALHCQEKTLKMVADQQGVFVVQVKENQPHLLDVIDDHIQIGKAL